MTKRKQSQKKMKNRKSNLVQSGLQLQTPCWPETRNAIPAPAQRDGAKGKIVLVRKRKFPLSSGRDAKERWMRIG